MRRALRALPVVCTLLLLALGACLPRLASLALDRRLEREILQREDASVSLELAQNDFFRTLELFQRQRSQIYLEEGRRMTAEEAQAAAVALMQDIHGSDWACPAPEATPVLLSDGDEITPGMSGIFWYCQWLDGEGRSENLWLDDSSGLLVAWHGRPAASDTVSSYAVASEPQSIFEAYCRQNYPADGVELRADWEDPRSGHAYFTLILSRPDGGPEKILEIPILISGDWVYFNCF